jgi:chromosome segregation ATPase
LLFSSSEIEEYQKQIQQLQRSLSNKDEERTLLRERLNEVELDLRTTLDEHAAKSTKYDENLQSLIEQLKKENKQILEELAILKEPIDCQHVEIQTDEK